MSSGLYYYALSVGSAVFIGAFTGTWFATGSAAYSDWASIARDGGNNLGFTLVAGGDVLDGGPEFTCDCVLPGTSLQAGSFSASDVSELSCQVIVFPLDGGYEGWQLVASSFELTIGSPGPSFTLDDDDGGVEWAHPTATISVTLAPDAFTPPLGNVGVGATVAPR